MSIKILIKYLLRLYIYILSGISFFYTQKQFYYKGAWSFGSKGIGMVLEHASILAFVSSYCC